MPAALDLPICGGRYRNRVLLSRSNEDDHILSDREFLDPDHNRAHPFDIPSACESKRLEEGVMRGEYDISVSQRITQENDGARHQ
jgi:hypothetical protein